ncbi:MAG: FAD synthetase family protein [Treponema sp.]|nr:FAD synthetase family protein [Treponema sp.]MCL2272080.1 FAD synthetase family protein [Treponema sp.]
MQVIDWKQFLETGLPSPKKSSMTVGVFDGVHLGHQALIRKIVSHNDEYVPAVVTFRENHKTGDKTEDIFSLNERLVVFESLGIQITIVIDFTKKFKKMPGTEFLELLLKHGSVGFFAAGGNFRCGYRLDTDACAIRDFFVSHNIPAEIVPEVTEDSLPVSSSRIRRAIAEGDTELAEKMLGRKNNADDSIKHLC